MSTSQQAFDAIVSEDRILIAIDAGGVHVRRTECVHHNNVSGEASYSTTPIGSFPVSPSVRKAIAAAADGGASQAQETFEKMGAEIEDGILRCGEPYVVQQASRKLILLDGTFNAAELEAILWHMRHG